MKKIFFVLGLVCIYNMGVAQTTIGLKLDYSQGVSSSKMLELDKENRIDYNLNYKGQENIISFGISSRTQLGPFFLAKDVMYRKTTNIFDLENFIIEDAVYERSVSETTHQFIVPIAAGFDVGDLYFGAGPILKYALDTERSAELTDAFVFKDRKFSSAFQFLAGFKLNKHIHLNLKYEAAMGSIGDGYYYNAEKINFKTAPNLLTAGLGLYF